MKRFNLGMKRPTRIQLLLLNEIGTVKNDSKGYYLSIPDTEAYRFEKHKQSINYNCFKVIHLENNVLTLYPHGIYSAISVLNIQTAFNEKETEAYVSELEKIHFVNKLSKAYINYKSALKNENKLLADERKNKSSNPEDHLSTQLAYMEAEDETVYWLYVLENLRIEDKSLFGEYVTRYMRTTGKPFPPDSKQATDAVIIPFSIKEKLVQLINSRIIELGNTVGIFKDIAASKEKINALIPLKDKINNLEQAYTAFELKNLITTWILQNKPIINDQRSTITLFKTNITNTQAMMNDIEEAFDETLCSIA